MKKVWRIFSSVFTIVGLVVLVLYSVPLPFFEQNSSTLMVKDRKAQIAVAKALSFAIGEPIAVLNTAQVKRFLFKDGTSVDYLVVDSSQFQPMYYLTSLKSVVLPFFSGSTSPTEIARGIQGSLTADGYKVQIETRPDPAFPGGATVLILSDAFRDESGAGFGVIVRKHAFRVGGPRPNRFRRWSS